MIPSSLGAEQQAQIRQSLEHPFDLMMEAIEYRMTTLREHDVRHFALIPEAEYREIRIYVSDLVKLRRFLDGSQPPLAYVSFIGDQRDDMGEAIEATDRALIGASPADSPIIGYFSLQDPLLAWVNLVLFDDLDTLSSWVDKTKHADDWARAAAYFTGIEKSVGHIRYHDGAIAIEPLRFVVRDYEVTAG